MTFNNSKTIISQRIKLFAATVLFLAFIILTYVAKIIPFPLLGMNETAWTLILVAVYLLILLYPTLLNYQYVSYSDDGDKIIVRYFFSGILGGRKNSIEIGKKSLSGYRVESQLFGLKQSLTLYQKLKEGVAKYPPVFISALTREEKNKILVSLNKYAPKA